MRFRDIESLLGWSFQMSQTQLIKAMLYQEQTSKCHSDLTMDERHKMAIDVIAKVSRLDRTDQACIVARHTWSDRSVHDAAYLLPNWTRPMTLALTRRWAGDTRVSQREIAEMCGCSQMQVSRREAEAAEILSAYYWHGCDMLEVQLLDLIEKRLIVAC